MAQVEGTANNGEDNNLEENDFYQWMISSGAKHKLVVKLINSGIDSIDMLQEVADDESILDDTDLNKIEKAKIRTILKQLSNQHTVIEKEESDAIIKMEKRLKLLANAVNLVDNTKQSIDEQVINHTKSIQSTFKQMHELLNQRETAMIKKLNEIANKKKNKLDDISKTLNQQTNTSQKQITTCHRKLKKSIELSQIENRKKEILKIANNIENIKVITKQDSVICDNKINIILDTKAMIKTINAFCNVYGGYLPVILSLIDNKDCSIGIEWKLNRNKEKQNNDKNCKLKVEWTDIELKNNDDVKNNGIDNEVKEEWKYNKEFILQNKQYSKIDIKVENKTIVYVIRIKYFDGQSWTNNSQTKSIAYKQIVVTNDKWDKNAVSQNISVNGNTVTDTGTGYRNVYLKNVVSQGIHIWRIKVNKTSSGNWNVLGIWKVESGPPILDNYWSSQANKGYGVAIGQGYTIKPNNPGHSDKKIWDCKSGDTITMTLNFNTLSLSYKINAKDYGKLFDIERTKYRAVAGVGGTTGDSYTLLSYERQ